MFAPKVEVLILHKDMWDIKYRPCDTISELSFLLMMYCWFRFIILIRHYTVHSRGLRVEVHLKLRLLVSLSEFSGPSKFKIAVFWNAKRKREFLFCEIGFVLFYTGAGKFCLAHGLRQLTRDTKIDVSCLQTLLTRRNEDLQMTFGVGRHTKLLVNILFKSSIFERMCKKNNPSSV